MTNNVSKKKIVLTVVLIALISLILWATHYLIWGRNDRISIFVETVVRLNTDQKAVALTFDDGPSELKTPQLLDLLAEYDVQASFFLLGKNAALRPETVTRLVNEGHTLGNHTYNHPRLPFTFPWTQVSEIQRTDESLTRAGATNLSYFRPPYSDEGLFTSIYLASQGKKIISYSLDPLPQYKSDYRAEDVSSFVIENVKPGDIIILHDGTEANTTEFLKSIEQIIVGLREAGYSFVTLEEI